MLVWRLGSAALRSPIPSRRDAEQAFLAVPMTHPKLWNTLQITMPRFSEAAPACVLLIRHAQKTGIPGDRDLSELGLQRGKALLSKVVQIVPKIDAIVAAKSSRKSRRPWLTVEPLAIDLGLTIEETWNTQDYEALASELLTSGRYRDQNVLICWRHDTLQALALALGVPEAPPWEEALYDVIWLLDMTGTQVLFRAISS